MEGNEISTSGLEIVLRETISFSCNLWKGSSFVSLFEILGTLFNLLFFFEKIEKKLR